MVSGLVSIHVVITLVEDVPLVFLFLSCLSQTSLNFSLHPELGEGGITRKIGWGVRPASQNPYPIYDQNQRDSLPYL